MKIGHKYLLFLFIGVLFSACSVRFTMSGASIPEDLKSFSVQYFVNRAPLINPTLSQTFTEALKDRISNESRLILVNNVGDCDFSGEITGYDTRAMAIQANAVSAETRLTMTVKVRYKNYKNPKSNWEQSFSAYEDFPSEKNINDIESELVRLITDKITENIFNKSFSDW
ncbi:MAG: LptE family protein [Breznakibacter sp.]|nr:LptE family protein [Breznakibacter sp.]